MSGKGPATTTPLKRRPWLWTIGLVAAAAAAGVAVPVVMLTIGTRRARACVASYEAPRDAALPDCTREIQWFVRPSRIPWTATPARYRAEELAARSAIAAYTDALVGHPDHEALARAATSVDTWAKALRDGSQRLALEELGTAVGAPNLGLQAALGGDRTTLLTHFDRWDDWAVRLRALEAALTEGDLPRASAIARRYADFDPRDEDLRTAVAATLCLGEDPARGIELFTSVQNDRAAQRHESWARNWGEVRAAIVGCAARAGVKPPAKPSRADAGQSDAADARAVLRLRLLTLPAARPIPRDASSMSDAVLGVVELLSTSRPEGARVQLLAALLAAQHELTVKELAELAAPKRDGGEASMLPAPAALTALDWLEARRALTPTLPAPVLREAVGKLKELAISAELTPEQADALGAAAGAAAIAAARAFADVGDGPSAIAALEEGGALALPSSWARALGRSSAWYLAGDRERALDELDQIAAASAPVPESLAASDKQVRAAALIQRTELLASLGRRDEASAAAAIAAEAALAAGHAGLAIRARWTRLALNTKSSPSAATAMPARAPGDRSWPWVGFAGTASSWLAPEAEGPAHIDQALAFWGSVQAASPAERRALRYVAFAHRGDLPNASIAYYTLAAELLGPGEGDMELWLDVFSAIDSHRLPLRSYAFLRTEAARVRGDGASAALWAERHRVLRAIVADPERAEIARFLGL